MNTVFSESDTALSTIGNARGNVIRLTIAQALAGANSTVVYATGAIIGDMLYGWDSVLRLIFVPMALAACVLLASTLLRRRSLASVSDSRRQT